MNAPGTPFRFVSTGRSDVGRVRSVNEDAFIERIFPDHPAIGLWAVADGMGGHALGDVASGRIVDLLDTVAPAEKASAFLAAVRRALEQANADLRHLGFTRAGGGIVGSTVAVLLAFGPNYACVWAGDSRIYRLHDGRLKLLTRDHSPVQELVDMGLISEQEASRHPEANVITRAVGAGPALKLSVGQGPIADGDVFLLCSDGLTRMVGGPAIERTLRQQPKTAADALVEQALAAGGEDNVTVVVVRCLLSAGRPEPVNRAEERAATERTLPMADADGTNLNPSSRG
jgi:serine/threonine protein phosphatase PrpC